MPPLNATRRLEPALGDRIRKLPPGLAEFTLFVCKQGWAALFGGLMLAGLIVTALLWQADWPIYRYDALFLYALLLQAMMLFFRLETFDEVRVIFLFHLTGTAMELFKTHMGSWSYPEPAILRLGEVPLFSGFMYAAVGSYIVRTVRIFEMRFAPYPPLWITFLLAGLIYLNFFTHHFLPDIRWMLIFATLFLYLRTRVWFYTGSTRAGCPCRSPQR